MKEKLISDPTLVLHSLLRMGNDEVSVRPVNNFVIGAACNKNYIPARN